MTYRAALPTRTWLDNTAYDLLVSPTVLHYDLFAYADIAGAMWFSIEARAGGVKLLARTLIHLCAARDRLEERTMAPQLRPVKWSRANAHVFRRVHRTLLAQCAALPGYNRLSVHCHYVPVLDCDPWPRGTVNTFHYGGRVGGIGQGKPRRIQRTPRDVLPDLL